MTAKKIKIIFSRLARLIVLIGLLLACWAFIWEPSRLTEKNYSLSIPNWPSSCSSFRVAVVSDLHAGAPYIGLEKIDRIVSLIQKQKPDMVLLPGDFVIQEVLGGSFIDPETVALHLKPLLQQTKVFAVLGNHDAWLDSRRVQRALESVGIIVLEDRAIPITNKQCQFWLLGISDYIEGMHDYQKAFAMVPAHTPILAFTHNPDVFPDIIKSEFSLLIAGHT